jgi:hypothetical protein
VLLLTLAAAGCSTSHQSVANRPVDATTTTVPAALNAENPPQGAPDTTPERIGTVASETGAALATATGTPQAGIPGDPAGAPNEDAIAVGGEEQPSMGMDPTQRQFELPLNKAPSKEGLPSLEFCVGFAGKVTAAMSLSTPDAGSADLTAAVSHYNAAVEDAPSELAASVTVLRDAAAAAAKDEADRADLSGTAAVAATDAINLWIKTACSR